MTKETFNTLLDELDSTSLETLKTKNAKYAPEDDALHNFHAGAEIMGVTTAQCIWGYATKHIVALRDKILRNDFSDIEDTEEKIQDIINYLRFIWCAANENNEHNYYNNNNDNYDYEKKCCSNCEFDNNNNDGYDPITEKCTIEPCKSCKYNFIFGTEEYKKAPFNWKLKK